MSNIEGVFRLSEQSPHREEALTHMSYASGEHRGAAHNRRLSILGKALMSAFLVECILDESPRADAGTVEQRRQSLMDPDVVGEFARGLGVAAELWIGRDPNDEMRESVNVISGAFFALVGACYIEGGPHVARQAVYLYGDAHIERAKTGQPPIRELERRCHRSGVTLEFEYLGDRGTLDSPVHEIAVLVDGRKMGVGQGRSKLLAKRAAAVVGLGEEPSGSPALVGQSREEPEASSKSPSSPGVARTLVHRARQVEVLKAR